MAPEEKKKTWAGPLNWCFSSVPSALGAPPDGRQGDTLLSGRNMFTRDLTTESCLLRATKGRTASENTLEITKPAAHCGMFTAGYVVFSGFLCGGDGDE